MPPQAHTREPISLRKSVISILSPLPLNLHAQPSKQPAQAINRFNSEETQNQGIKQRYQCFLHCPPPCAFTSAQRSANAASFANSRLVRTVSGTLNCNEPF